MTIDATPAGGLTYLEATMGLVNCPGNRITRTMWPHDQFVEFGDDKLARLHGHGTLGGDPVPWNTTMVDVDANDYIALVNNPRPPVVDEVVEGGEGAAEQEPA